MGIRNMGTFAVVISQRQQIFSNIQPYSISKDGNYESIKDVDGLTDAQIEIVRCCQECEDSHLLKKFSRCAVSITSLMEELSSNRQMSDLFWSYIDKRYTRVVQLLQTSSSPVFLRTNKDFKFCLNKPLQLCANPVSSNYHFELTETGLRYWFELTDGTAEICLNGQKKFLALTHQPCVFILGDTLYLSERNNHKALEVMAKKGEINVPPEKVELYLQTFVKKMLQTEDADCKGFTINTVSAELKAKLTHTTDTFGKDALKLDFCYGELQFPFSSEKKHQVDLRKENGQYIFEVMRRDIKRENELMSLLRKQKVYDNGDYLYLHDNGKTLYQLLAESDIAQNFEIGYEYRLEADITEKEDWFDVRMIVETHGYRIPFSTFRRHILKRQTTYTLPDGSIFHLPEEWFTRYCDLFEKASCEGDHLKLEKRYAGIIEDESETVRSYIRQLSTSNIIVPDKLNATLRPYQQEGFNFLTHLYQQGYGGCLADDMGLGKTLQFITFFTHLYANATNIPRPAVEQKTWKYSSSEPTLFDQLLEEEPAAPPVQQATAKHRSASIVVVPTTVLFNWENELLKFSPNLRYTIFYGNKRLSHIKASTFDAYHLVLTTYSVLVRDAEKLANYPFECAVLDESQNIKNPLSQSHLSAKRLQAKSRFVVTGTPIENSLSDLWAQMNFACPGLLGNYHAFNEHYTADHPERLDNLKKLVRPFILRRTKKEVCTELPELTKIDIWCEMEEREQKAYDTEKSAVRNAIMNIGGHNTLSILQQLTRLRQMACDPSLLPEYADMRSVKREWAVEWAKELHQSGNKVLLFSAFVKQLTQIANDLRANDIPFDMLTGETTGESRQKIVERFQNDAGLTCLLVSLKAGSTGINLTAANYVFLLSPWWNPFAEQQAIDRAYRIGQKNKVTVYNFITKNTVEEKILHLQEKKRKLANSIINSENPLQHLTTKDLEELV